MKYCSKYLLAAALLSSVTAFAGEASAPYDNTRIDARLNVAVKDDTQVVHFVRDNADPNVITKAYEIKHTDPYELRSYIRSIVQTRKVDENNTNVEAVKYADGSALLLISAEDYRFEDTPGAQGFDSIVRELDKPKLVSGSGLLTYVYSPKFRSSEDLMEMVKNVGAYSRNEAMNNVGGNDVLMEDPDLNLIFFNTAPFSKQNIMDVISKYDRIEPSIRAKVTVYELYAENDTKLGLDFQAWKNNDGLDLFNAGGRFSQNHNGIGLVRGGKWNKTTYFQFNPKWNTKYIDFLTSRGKAKVLHSSELTVSNNAEGKIEKYTQFFVAKAEPVPSKAEQEAIDSKKILHKQGNTVQTEASGKFGFSLVLKPFINTAATKLKVQISNSSLIGYTSDGTPRIQQGAGIDTEFMISNGGTKLVIGGIEKRSVVQVSGGLPILKDLPVLGWLFSTETEATKRSQLLVVAEVIPAVKAQIPGETLKTVSEELVRAGETNTYGYRQYLLDSKRK